MKRKTNGRGKAVVLILGVLLWCGGLAQATPVDVNIYSSTTIDSGEYGTVNIYDTAPDQTIVDMTDGWIQNCNTYDSSVLELNSGEIRSLLAYEDSTVNMYGGEVSYGFDLNDSTIANIYGGNISYHLAAFSSSVINIYGYAFTFTPSGSSYFLSGYWGDTTEFEIYLRGPTTYPRVVLHEIPEPASLLFFSLISIPLLKRNR